MCSGGPGVSPICRNGGRQYYPISIRARGSGNKLGRGRSPGGFPHFVGTAGDIITQYQSEPGVPVIKWGHTQCPPASTRSWRWEVGGWIKLLNSPPGES